MSRPLASSNANAEPTSVRTGWKPWRPSPWWWRSPSTCRSSSTARRSTALAMSRCSSSMLGDVDGYPLYEVTDLHGWSYHYPPIFALMIGPFHAVPSGFPRPSWALPLRRFRSACSMRSRSPPCCYPRMWPGRCRSSLRHPAFGKPQRLVDHQSGTASAPGTVFRRILTRPADHDPGAADLAVPEICRRPAAGHGLARAGAGDRHQDLPGSAAHHTAFAARCAGRTGDDGALVRRLPFRRSGAGSRRGADHQLLSVDGLSGIAEGDLANRVEVEISPWSEDGGVRLPVFLARTFAAPFTEIAYRLPRRPGRCSSRSIFIVVVMRLVAVAAAAASGTGRAASATCYAMLVAGALLLAALSSTMVPVASPHYSARADAPAHHPDHRALRIDAAPVASGRIANIVPMLAYLAYIATGFTLLRHAAQPWPTTLTMLMPWRPALSYLPACTGTPTGEGSAPSFDGVACPSALSPYGLPAQGDSGWRRRRAARCRCDCNA